MFETTFNNISAISWRSVLLVEDKKCQKRSINLVIYVGLERLSFRKETVPVHFRQNLSSI
jgi:hypothetical protein